MRKIPIKGGKRYDIDIREFLSIKGDAVIHRALDEIRGRVPAAQQAAFSARTPGSFDFRKRQIAKYVDSIPYIPSDRKFDAWLFPAETIAQGGGDCEDRAFLLAALLEASGISSYCIRVALGVIIDRTDPGAERRFHHAWVMYFAENGAWEIVEPLAADVTTGKRARGRAAAPGGRAAAPRGRASAPRGKDSRLTADIEYVPHFVFNGDHLWRVRSEELEAAKGFLTYLQDRKFWKGFDPTFAAGVHDTIFDYALATMDPDDLASVKSASLWVDVNVVGYDPRDHFDFAYVDAAWKRVNARLATGDLHDFALAAHAVADFYAHTVYGIYAPPGPDGRLPIYDPNNPLPPATLTYDFTKFDALPGCRSTKIKATQHWNGSLISGQWWRWYTTFPDDLEKQRLDLAWRRCLPDHDHVAVDSSGGWASGHMLTQAEFTRQFGLRKLAAIQHIKQVYNAWK